MARKDSPGADVDQALALMRQGRLRGHKRRSPVLLWMLKNREALERGFQETTPSWEVLAQFLDDHGIMDGDGKRPSAVVVRQAWYRTRAVAKPKTRMRKVAAANLLPAMADAGAAAENNEESSSEPTRFALATLRNHTPAAPAVEAPARPAPAKHDAEAAIRRLLGDQPRRRFQQSVQQED